MGAYCIVPFQFVITINKQPAICHFIKVLLKYHQIGWIYNIFDVFCTKLHTTCSSRILILQICALHFSKILYEHV